MPVAKIAARQTPAPSVPLGDAAFEARVAAVRHFNRLYTRRIGLLQKHYLDSPYSLAEMRVLYEIAKRDRPTATDVARELGLDAGYLSRILANFEKHGLIARTKSDTDARQSLLALTPHGEKSFAPFEQRSRDVVADMLDKLSEAEQQRMVAAMTSVERMIAPSPDRAPYLLRQHRIGDMGWIVARHGALYAQEYGWDGRIEALCAEIVAKFIRRYDAERERCFIAERDGENLGCVMLVKDSAKVARLRLFLVEPSARGLGIGTALVDECIRFARLAGYKRITLWTHAVLVAARHIYERRGFTLTRTWTHEDFGKELVAETWDLKL